MGSERTHVDKYLCTVCGHRHSNGWHCKYSIDAKDAEIERLKAALDAEQKSNWTPSFLDLINTHLRECGQFHGHEQVKTAPDGLSVLRSVFGQANMDRTRANGLAQEVAAKREHFLNPSVDTLHRVNEAEAFTDNAGWLKEHARTLEAR